uniref:Uncharacterized protein n=1 Tax=Manihot esculenta TaxID=3983 RepID=A0A2C9VRX0_MANES
MWFCRSKDWWGFLSLDMCCWCFRSYNRQRVIVDDWWNRH